MMNRKSPLFAFVSPLGPCFFLLSLNPPSLLFPLLLLMSPSVSISFSPYPCSHYFRPSSLTMYSFSSPFFLSLPLPPLKSFLLYYYRPSSSPPAHFCSPYSSSPVSLFLTLLPPSVPPIPLFLHPSSSPLVPFWFP